MTRAFQEEAVRRLRNGVRAEYWQRKILSVPQPYDEKSKATQFPSLTRLAKALEDSRSTDHQWQDVAWDKELRAMRLAFISSLDPNQFVLEPSIENE